MLTYIPAAAVHTCDNVGESDIGEVGFSLKLGTPWHKKEQYKTHEEEVPFEVAAKALKWEVSHFPCCAPDGTPTGAYGLADNEGHIIHPGGVTASFGIIQNSRLLDAAGRLMATDEGLKIESAMTLGNRKTVLINLLFGEMVVEGDNSPTVMRLTLSNSHGFGPFKAYAHYTRIVCQNTLNASLADANHLIKIRHTAAAADTLEVKVDKLTDFIAASRKDLENLGKLSKFSVSDDMVANLLLSHFDVKKDDTSRTGVRRKNMVDQVLGIYNNKADLVDLDKSGYRLLNAITDFYDHTAEKRGEFKDDIGVQFIDSFTGGNADSKTGFRDTLFALAGI